MSFKDDLAYLKSVRVYIGFSVLTFIVTVIAGYFAAASNPDIIATWLKELEMLKWITTLPPIAIFLVIFLKNLLASAMSILLGLGLGLFPFLVVTTNGIMLGVVSYSIIQKQGLLYLLAGVLPHGIIELPTVLMSVGIGFRLGYLIAISIAGEKTDLKGETKKAIHFLVRWVAPLLLLAAAIETFITPIVISLVA